MYWWKSDPTENIFMEITGRLNIGDDLLAPVAARGGSQTPGYALVTQVRRGDLVVHYDSNAEAIVGVSRAIGGPEPAQIFWAARGSSARQAREEPRMLPGVQVPLDEFIGLEPLLDLQQIRARGDELIRLRDDIHRDHSQPVYFPWVPYGTGPIRTAQTYLAKLPREAVRMFPVLQKAVAGLDGTLLPLESDEVQLIDQALSDLAGKRRPHRGQGFKLNQEVKVAVEAHAMDLAISYFAERGTVDDVHGNQSFDLCCTIDGDEWHVEVKGTTTPGDSVLLTPLEVSHARGYDRLCLFVVSDIQVQEVSSGQIETSGGSAWFVNPWDIEHAGDLTPVGYSYAIHPAFRQSVGT